VAKWALFKKIYGTLSVVVGLMFFAAAVYMLASIGHSTLVICLVDAVLGGMALVCGVLLIRNASKCAS